MKSIVLALSGALLATAALAMPPAGGQKTPPAAPKMPITASTGARVIWSCNVGQLGSLPVMVDYAEKKALSARGSAIATATIAGDVATWQETDAADGTYRFQLNRKSRDLQVTLTPPKGKAVVHKGTCGTPDPNRKPGGHGAED